MGKENPSTIFSAVTPPPAQHPVVKGTRDTPNTNTSAKEKLPSPLDMARQKNEKLFDIQMKLMREKIKWKEKKERLEEILAQMKHTPHCLMETCTHIIKTDDLSTDLDNDIILVLPVGNIHGQTDNRLSETKYNAYQNTVKQEAQLNVLNNNLVKEEEQDHLVHDVCFKADLKYEADNACLNYMQVLRTSPDTCRDHDFSDTSDDYNKMPLSESSENCFDSRVFSTYQQRQHGDLPFSEHDNTNNDFKQEDNFILSEDLLSFTRPHSEMSFENVLQYEECSQSLQKANNGGNKQAFKRTYRSSEIWTQGHRVRYVKRKQVCIIKEKPEANTASKQSVPAAEKQIVESKSSTKVDPATDKASVRELVDIETGQEKVTKPGKEKGENNNGAKRTQTSVGKTENERYSNDSDVETNTWMLQNVKEGTDRAERTEEITTGDSGKIDGCNEEIALAGGAKAGSSKQEITTVETFKVDSFKQEITTAETTEVDSSKQDTTTAETTEVDSSKQEITTTETFKVDSSKQEITTTETFKVDSFKQEITTAETTEVRSSKQEITTAQTPNVDSCKQELTTAETANMDSCKQEITTAETAKVDSSKQEITTVATANDDSSRQEITTAELANGDSSRQEITTAETAKVDCYKPTPETAKLYNLKQDITTVEIAKVERSEEKITIGETYTFDSSTLEITAAETAKVDSFRPGITTAETAEIDFAKQEITTAKIAEVDSSKQAITTSETAKVDFSSQGITTADIARVDSCKEKITTDGAAKVNSFEEEITVAYTAKVDVSSKGITTADTAKADVSTEGIRRTDTAQVDRSNNTTLGGAHMQQAGGLSSDKTLSCVLFSIILVEENPKMGNVANADSVNETYQVLTENKEEKDASTDNFTNITEE